MSAESKAVAPGRSVGGTSTTASAVPTTTTAAGAGSVASSSAGAPASVLPLGGPRVDIPCADGGYIVQVASELDPATFEQRVTGLRAAGQLPPDAKWAEATASCPIFTTQVNVEVLYAGPFPSPTTPARPGWPARRMRSSRGRRRQSSTEYVSCLCPATVSTLPTISSVGQQGVWVGELQRVLGTGLDYDIGPDQRRSGDRQPRQVGRLHGRDCGRGGPVPGGQRPAGQPGRRRRDLVRPATTILLSPGYITTTDRKTSPRCIFSKAASMSVMRDLLRDERVQRQPALQEQLAEHRKVPLRQAISVPGRLQ